VSSGGAGDREFEGFRHREEGGQSRARCLGFSAPMPGNTRRQLACLAVAVAVSRVSSEIYEYHLKLQEVTSSGNLRFRQSGMYAPHDAPSKTAPGNGHSFIDLGDMKLFPAPHEVQGYGRSGATFVDVAVFESRHFDEIGVESDGVKHYCCTAEQRSLTGCHPLRSLIVNEAHHTNGSIDLIRIPVPLEEGSEPVTVADHAYMLPGRKPYHKYKVKSTGLYTVLLANCDDTDAADILVQGQTEWMNPYGYLPGELYGMMPFFGVLASLYVVLGAVWLILCALNWSELLVLQMWISVVVGMGMLETGMKFADYLTFNAEGERNMGMLATGLVFGVTKRAVSRVLVVMVSLGYSIVKPSLGPQLHRVLLLGLIYFVLAVGYDMLVNLAGTNKNLGDPGFVDSLTLIVLFMSLVDVVFYMWILQALMQTIAYLDARKQSVKLQLFRRFRTVLIISVLFSIAWAIFTVVASAPKYFKRHWQSAWSVNAVWEVLYLIILVAVAVLFMPSKNSQRYAYSLELATVDPDDMEEDELDEDEAEYGGALDDGEAGGDNPVFPAAGQIGGVPMTGKLA